MRKKIVVVCSDIVGTYLDNIDEERTKRIQEFIKEICDIKEKTGSSAVVFSFITDDDVLDNLNYCDQEFRSLKPNDVFIGKHFYDQGSIYGGTAQNASKQLKAIKICNYIKSLSEEYDVVKVIYIDDSEFNIDVAQKVIENYGDFECDLILSRGGLKTANKGLSQISNNIKPGGIGSI